ncbi:hypothetical protein VTK73DRAFT_1212 [Phialemonium thermophilum]|uniref:Protein kinase domain-containing protein n=1 Tax=Phialemonium thermophilum TaxID=223376 RepID=A0ABR3VTR9_9PEZI
MPPLSEFDAWPKTVPYQVGDTLNLRIDGTQDDGTRDKVVVRISRLVQPWTLSAVMVVDVLDAPSQHNIPPQAFLKLYDRRCFSPGKRKRWRVGLWTPEREQELLVFLRSGEAAEFLKRYREDSDFDDDGSWSPAQNEATLSEEMYSIYETEVQAYASLAKHQGRHIPRLYAKVSLDIGPPHDRDTATDPAVAELFVVPGILIEYVQGFRMSDLARNIDRSDWNRFVNRAVDVTRHILKDSDVINQDVRPDNMLVCRTAPGGEDDDDDAGRGYRFVMVDFGLCRFREEGETIEKWGLAKHRQDEEGAMGEVMKIKLREEAGFEADFKNPLTWIDYAERG